MILPHFHVGCDISSQTVDVFDARQGSFKRIANTPDALTAWLSSYRATSARFVFEATGAYGVALQRALAQAGLSAIEVNPVRARRFAQSTGVMAKTDRIDARMLADMGGRLELPVTPPFEESRFAFKALITRRDQLVAICADERRRLRQCQDEATRDSLNRMAAMLDRELKLIEARIQAATRQDTAMARDRKRLMSIPGVGPVTASILLSMMPELGALTPKAAASLAGCAPHANDSGGRRGQRTVRGGRPRVLKALYMAALTASRSNNRFAEKYEKLRTAPDRLKPAKVAIIAIARKIIVIANALMRDKSAYA